MSKGQAKKGHAKNRRFWRHLFFSQNAYFQISNRKEPLTSSSFLTWKVNPETLAYITIVNHFIENQNYKNKSCNLIL